ncbi:hypothetical protein ACWEN6_13760 [Sphaerisporangium sp. NPDC004334]
MAGVAALGAVVVAAVAAAAAGVRRLAAGVFPRVDLPQLPPAAYTDLYASIDAVENGGQP